MKKLQPKFSNFSYRIVESTLDFHHEVEVTFEYGKIQAKRMLYIPTLENQPDAYYIERAKERIAEEIENGSLIKYTTKNFGNRPSSKTALKAAVWILAIAMVGTTGYLVYRALPFNNKHKITFMTDGGSKVAAEYVMHGEIANKPANPEKPGYTFQHWCSDDALSTIYNFDEPVIKDIVLYADWGNIHEFNVTISDKYGVLDGDVVLEHVTYGTKWSDLEARAREAISEHIVDPINYDLSHFSLNQDAEEPIEDDKVFILGETVYTYWDVYVRFDQNEERSKLPKTDGWFPINDTISAHYDEIKPEIVEYWNFSNFTYIDEETGEQPVDGSERFSKYAGKTLLANYVVQGVNFETDPWDVFIAELNKWGTLQKLKQGEGGEVSAYAAQMPVEGIYAGTFLGFHRTVTIGDKEYAVKVVDEPLTDEIEYYGLDTPFFTFEFEDVLDISQPYNPFELDEDGKEIQNNAYYDFYKDEFCNIARYVNEDIYAALPEDLRNSIIGSRVPYYCYNHPWGTYHDEFSKLFIPSMRRMSGYTGENERTGGTVAMRYLPDGTRVEEEQVGTVQSPSVFFSYYDLLRKGNDDLDNDNLKAARTKTLGETPVSYWLSSADQTTSQFAWKVNADGSVATLEEGYYTTDVTTKLYVAPAFNVGIAGIHD